ncbi:MAG TPA: flagellar biosynthetic protein FliQ [Candidatus Methylomirabilis sp.]|nr:flagellar biosynthetic protein FliQ [Candidatus Methylomirabilis sp.]
MTIVDLTHVIDCSREALRMSLLLGGPLLAVALLAGLVINVLQTVTQLHEPVVGLVPRLVAVLLVLLAILPWLVGQWVSFTVDLIGSIPDLL